MSNILVENTKDIQSPERGNTSLNLFGVFYETPASGDFSISRKKGQINIVPDSGKTVFRVNPTFFLNFKNEEKRAFSLLLILKKYSSHGRIWKYNPVELSKQIGISKYCLEKYVRILKKRKYCYTNEQGDLVLVSLSKIMEDRKKSRIIVCDSDSINDIVDKINYLLLRFSFSRQNFVRRLKRNELEAKDAKYRSINNLSRSEILEFLKERKACVKIKKISGKTTRGELLDYNIVGMRRLSEILNCSTKKTVCFLNLLKKNNVIKTSEVVKLHCRNVRGNFDYVEYKKSINKNAGYLFKVGSFVYLHLGTRIDLCEDTI